MSSEDLRKRVLSGSGNVAANGSGNSSPVLLSKNSSEVNLTKSELYALYDNDPFGNLSNDDIEFMPPSSSSSSQKIEEGNEENHNHKPYKFDPVLIMSKLAVLTLSSYIYNNFTQSMHMLQINQGGNQVKPILFLHIFLSKFAYNLRPFQYFETGTSLKEEEAIIRFTDLCLAYMIQGLGMSCLHPIMDKFLPKQFSQRLLSSAPQLSRKELQKLNLLNDLIRLFVTFLGILYAVRRIEWASAVQLLILWSLLNPCLWLLLDGTISGFILSSLAAIGAIGLIYIQNLEFIKLQAEQSNNDQLATLLYVGSYFFCGLIIFGKLGRALF